MSNEEIDDSYVNVFVHSTSGLPDAWSEEEIGVLLSVWREVLEQSPNKRFDIVKRVLKRLKGIEGFRQFDKQEKRKAKEDIRKQMDGLRTEYQVYKGILKIKGLNAYRDPCVDQLEYIIDRIPQSRKGLDTNQADVVSEDSDYSRRLSVSEGEVIRSATPRNNKERNRNQDEVPNQKPRFQQRRMNLTRLVRVMVGQQQTMLEQLEKLFNVLEISNERMVGIMETVVTLRNKNNTGAMNLAIPDVIVEDAEQSSEA